MISKYIVVTGAAGFIGSNLIRRLNKEGLQNLILVDHFGLADKDLNLSNTKYAQKIERESFPDWLRANSSAVDFIFHLGARTDTTEFDFSVLEKLNLEYSKTLWEICSIAQVPFLYASSAATYGLGEKGFSDAHELIPDLKPLNPYGLSKQLFDVFVLQQKKGPPFWVGLKFFNVYGPHELHKGRMASVAFHAFRQISEMGKMKLFKSHKADYKDGEQLRDFIYVEDIVDICLFFFREQKDPGIYNCGTGEAKTFNELAIALFQAMHLPTRIEYIPIPEDIRDKYQYFTEARIDKLRSAGFEKSFTSLQEGVRQYTHFLQGE